MSYRRIFSRWSEIHRCQSFLSDLGFIRIRQKVVETNILVKSNLTRFLVTTYKITKIKTVQPNRFPSIVQWGLKRKQVQKDYEKDTLLESNCFPNKNDQKGRDVPTYIVVRSTSSRSPYPSRQIFGLERNVTFNINTLH